MSIPVLLDAVVIDDDNDTIRIIENGVTSDVAITHGTYTMRGDGSSTDLLKAVTDALTTATGANTYSGAATFDSDSDNFAAVVVISRATGTNTWGVQWAATQTTFDPAWLGFADANETPANVVARTSTKTPTTCWVSNCDPADSDADYEADGYVFVGNSGAVAAGLYGGPFDLWTLALELVDGERMHAHLNTTDPAAALSTFWARAIRGGWFEVHLCALASASVTTTEQPDSGTLLGAYHLHEDSQRSLRGARFNRASSLWSWVMRLRKRVA